MFNRFICSPAALLPIWMLVTGAPAAFAQHENGGAACAVCHQSAHPAAGDAALKPCARPHAIEKTAKEAPDVFIIGELSEIYVPVAFPHKLHAEMMDMGGGCVVCHHQSPGDHIPRCSECHGGPSNPVNLRQPSLKGSYHRQCLGCHREWSGETNCIICHAKRVPGEKYTPPADVTDLIGMLHPNIEVPDKKVYVAENLEEAPIITFHHKDHEVQFGLSCASCHKQESCGDCHDVTKRRLHVREEPHQDCVPCHTAQTENNCAFCHDTTERGPFEHFMRSGYSLKPYHEAVTCQQCHTAPDTFEGVDPACDTCHAADWFPEAFDHKITGIPLDEEVHAAIPCEGCHGQGLGKPTQCDACHEDGRKTFPEEYLKTLLASPAGETPAGTKAEPPGTPF